MVSNLLYDYGEFKKYVSSCPNITVEYMSRLWISVYQSDKQNRFSEPVPLIGMYIVLASLFCIIAMVADLLHGLQFRRLWFPCKYFTLNAASLTVIAVAIKLPMDLTNLMPGYVDQASKIGSLSFMCILMANILPSLASMGKKELVTNMIALGVLVITLAVNVCIQINTGVLAYQVDEAEFVKIYARYRNFPIDSTLKDQNFFASIYVSLLLTLMIIYSSASVAILKSKKVLESKYQAAHEAALKDQDLQQLTIEKLKQHVSNYWIMAGTGNPQFMSASFATTCASGIICALSTSLHIFIMPVPHIRYLRNFNSDYKWSMLVILIVQFIGVIVGTIAPISRCFAALSFKLSGKWIWKHIKVSKVEWYWTQMLSDWKQSTILFPSGSRKCKIFIQTLKILILNICIGFQTIAVVSFKIVAVIPNFFVICVLYCSSCWKWLKGMFSASTILLVPKPEEQIGKTEDLSLYVLQLEDDMEFAERTMKGILKSLNHLIEKSEKQQPNNLMKLLAESKGFEGVKMFDNHLIPSLLQEEYLNCWSLPLVTLTAIAMSLPNMEKNIVDCLLINGVSEGLRYVRLLEESLNSTDDEVIVQKAAKTLWEEVDLYHKWLGNKLQNPDPQLNKAGQILQWLKDTAKNMVTEVEGTGIIIPNDNFKRRSIFANSMYRITGTLLLSYHTNIDELTQEELFVQLSLTISDILAACLTNLPQVILMKCHTGAIEKREASVQAAAQLLSETTLIINTLQQRELPILNPDELPFIDKWRAYLMNPFP